MVIIKLKGNFLPLYIHDLKPFARWKASISVYANIKLPIKQSILMPFFTLEVQSILGEQHRRVYHLQPTVTA
jgi:hypothetical protein